MTTTQLVETLRPHFRKVAVALIKRYRSTAILHLDAEDLTQEGMLAACSAVSRWRPDGGVPLEDFCRRRGVGAMRDAVLRANETIVRKSGVSGRRVLTQLCRRTPLLEEHGPASGRRPAPPAFESVEAFYAILKSAELDWQSVRVLTARFVEGLSMREIGDDLGVTDVRVSQLTKAGIKKLRKFFNLEVD